MKIRRKTLLIAAVALAACSDQSPPGPGTLTATLASPHGAEGSALVILLGQGIGEVTADGDTDVYANASDGSVRVVLINQQGGALSFRVAVADTTVKPEWVVQEVAGPDDEIRPFATGYEVTYR